MTDAHPLLADSPIRKSADDLFGRQRLARRIAAEAVLAPGDDGFVIALCGPWGSGKTSLANMVIEGLDPEHHLAVRFNPWVFSGTEDLIGRFFGELMNRLGKNPGPLRNIASRLGSYAGALSGGAGLIPGVGSTASTLLRSAEQVASLAGQGKTLEERRDALVEALAEFDGRIVVFLDDLDRLTDTEIREIVRLVKLVGDLPRVTYILAFDRDRVEQALGAPEKDPGRARDRGRAFLEKIVQSQHDIPPLRRGTVLEFMLARINAAIAPYPQWHSHEHDFNNMLGLAFRHMVQTPRDAVRIANAMPAAMELDGEEVALADLIGLEALHVLEPDVHAGLADIADILTGDQGLLGDTDRRDTESRQRLDAIVERARHPDAVRALLGQLFPKAGQALGGGRGFASERQERAEQRVAIPSVLRAYLHRSLDDDAVAAGEMRHLLGLFGDPGALHEALARLTPKGRDDAIDRLTDFREHFEPSRAVEVAGVILALSWDLPDEPIFLTGKVPGPIKVKWLIGWLLHSEPDEERRADLVHQIVEGAPDLSTRLRILNWFGTHPESSSRDPDAETLDADSTARLIEDFIERMAAASPDQLLDEPSLPFILWGVVGRDEARGRELLAEKASDDAFMLALLRAHDTATASVTLGEAAVRRKPHLAWKALVELLGEDYLRQRVEQLRERTTDDELDPDTRAALQRAIAIVDGVDEAEHL